MLRVAEHWYGSDVGRQRQGNEDSLFVQSPLFVVADGMGGAQAGEVASELAVEAFRDGLPAGSPEAGLVQTINVANVRINDAARADRQRQGMGTTCTAAYVSPGEVVLAHVGDSRCYLLRDGELTRLTRDHSLVGELMDRGKLTEEEAEVHPQRSVITRALGIEADLLVDTERIHGRTGDVFLICSDGLTSMVREAKLVELLRRGEDGPLPDLGRALIAAANEAGGRDNITVVLFRLEEVGEPASGGDEGATSEHPAVRDEPAQATGTSTATLAPAAPSVPLRTAPPPQGDGRPAPKRRGRVRRAVPWLVSLLVVLVLVGVGGWVAIRAVFFIGLDANRAVVIYRGLPYELPLGIDLYSRDYTSGVTLDQVSPGRRATFTNHKLRSFGDATDLVRQLETGKVK